MAKAPSEARIPSSGRIPVPKVTKGAVRRTIQGGLNAGTKLLPSKIKLPILKPKSIDTNKKLIENCNDQENKTCSDAVQEKIPAIAGALNCNKDTTFSLCDKIDPEKTIDILPDIANKTFDLNEKANDVADKKQMDANKKEQHFVREIEVNKFSESIGKKVTAIIPEDSASVHSVPGILRYFGRVQTDDDIWCGIETDKPSPEYHDGSVNGVKYFSCKFGHGLLIPATYVILEYQSQFIPDPKILEFRKKLQHMKTKSSKSLDEGLRPNVVDITQDLIENDEHQSDSGPYSLLVGLNNTVTKSDNQLNNLENVDILSNTLTLNPKFQMTGVNGSIINTYSNTNAHFLNKFKDMCNGDEIKMIEDESVLDLQGYSMDSVSDSLTDSRRKSSIISQPLDVSQKFNSPVIHGRFSAESKSTPLPEEYKQIDLTKKFEISKKCSRIANQYDRQFKLQQPARKQNAKPPTILDAVIDDTNKPFQVSEYKIMKTAPVGTIGLLSPTVSENSNQELSKQNSFEESLGILTPEQMESLSFLENIFSPSTDDFVGMLESDKGTEKTESSSTQTPTENIKSLTPDAIQLLLNPPADTTKIIENSNESENGTFNNTIVYTEEFPDSDQVNILLDNGEIQNESYESFIQRPFRQSTAENLTNVNDICSAASQTIDDELLPSVHSSILDALSSIVDTTRFDNIQHSVRMDQTPSPEELPLDPVDIKSDCMTLSVDPKTDTSKSVTYSITSITSLDGYQGDGEMSRPVSRGADQSPTIGHRGVNNIQNWQNIPINRRPDPMTDSDFFTESDADGHDEQVHRGDRRAQVIDGALYGGGKSSNPPVLVSRNNNNNSNDDSCMESSGVFTDMETHRSSPLLLNVIDDLSPEGSSSSTRSDVSQNNNSEMFHAGFNDTLNNTVIAINSPQNLLVDGENKENLKSENKNISVNASPSNSSNEKMNKEDKNMALKKYKMPRRDVASKVKSMMTSSSKSLADQEKQAIPKKEGRWDAVMNKISVNKTDTKQKFYLKDVKPKVNSAQSSEKTSFCEDNSVASSTSKPKAKASLTKLKTRRVKSSRMPKINMLDSSSRSTPHSSQSDLSVSCSAPTKIASAKHTVTRAAKKRDASVAGPGRPLSPQGAPPPPQPPAGSQPTPRNRTPPASNGRPVNTLVKKPVGVSSLAASTPTPVVNNASPPKGIIPQRKPIPRRAATQLSPRSPSLKDQNRASSTANVLKVGQGAGTAPALPAVPVVPQPPPNRGVEALAVLVQYLVFHLDALNAPRWRAQAAGAKAQLAEAAGRLQRAIASQIADHHTLTQSLAKITQLEDELRTKETEHNNKILATTTEAESKYRAALEESSALCAEIKSLKSTLNQLKQDVADSRIRVVRAEDATRKHEAEKAALLNDLKLANEEVEKLRAANLETEKNLAMKKQEVEDCKLAQQEIRESSIKSAVEEFSNLLNASKDSNQSTPRMKQNKMAAEIESLKAVLEMKMDELSELRKKHEEYQNAAEQLPAALQRIATLSTTVEDLKTQINRKIEDEVTLTQQNKQLQESFSRESALNDGLSRNNEELRYKLKQITEVVHYLRLQNNASNQRRMGLSVPDSIQNQTYPNFVRGHDRTTASFNEKYLHSTSFQDRRSEWRPNLRRTTRSESCDNKTVPSDKNRLSDFFQNDDLSPPNSPKVKGIVEKNDSVSYVLEIETPEEMVTRLTRRSSSFRVTTSPPSREATKRQRTRPKGSSVSMSAHSLAQSASASCIEPSALRGSSHSKLFRSNSIERNQYISPMPLRTSTPSKSSRGKELCSPNKPFEKVPINGLELASSFKNSKAEGLNNSMQSPSFEAAASIANGELSLLSECESVPKESAGEALISGANSEDDSSLDEPSNSSSDSESGSECDKYINMNGAGERLADPVLQKIAETLDQSLSATPMDVSWSEDGLIGVSESDI